MKTKLTSKFRNAILVAAPFLSAAGCARPDYRDTLKPLFYVETVQTYQLKPRATTVNIVSRNNYLREDITLEDVMGRTDEEVRELLTERFSLRLQGEYAKPDLIKRISQLRIRMLETYPELAEQLEAPASPPPRPLPASPFANIR